MYLWARSRLANTSRPGEAAAAVVEAAGRASGIIGRPVWAWASVVSPATGTFMWSTRVDSLDEIVAGEDAIFASKDFMKFIKENDDRFTGPLTDSVSEVVYGAPDETPNTYVMVGRAAAANGSLGEASAIGVEIAEYATKSTGRTTLLATSVTGEFGGFRWITGYPDLATLSAETGKLGADQDWIKLLDRAGHAFAPGVTTSVIRRIN